MGLDDGGGIDPYLEAQIRLADRQGLLVGRALSPVQFRASETMLILEEQAKAHDAMEALKLAHVANDPGFWLPKLYPAIFAEPEERSYVEATDADLADTTGEWQFTEEVDPAEAQRMLNEMLAQPVGRINGADVEGWA